MHPNRLIKIINREFNIDILQKTRKREIVEARMIFAKLCFDKNKFSLMRVGSYINKNHATIIHYFKQHDNLMEFDIFYKMKYKKILALVNHYQANNIDKLNPCEFKIKRYETSTNKV